MENLAIDRPCAILPLRNYVVVEPVVREQSAILWTANYEKYCKGIVRAVGKGKRSKKTGERIPLSVSPGDLVRYGNGSYLDWDTYLDQGKYYQLIMEADITAIEED